MRTDSKFSIMPSVSKRRKKSSSHWCQAFHTQAGSKIAGCREVAVHISRIIKSFIQAWLEMNFWATISTIFSQRRTSGRSFTLTRLLRARKMMCPWATQVLILRDTYKEGFRGLMENTRMATLR
jgi:hypothetical protein